MINIQLISINGVFPLFHSWCFSGEWDQFKANAELFGYVSTYKARPPGPGKLTATAAMFECQESNRTWHRCVIQQTLNYILYLHIYIWLYIYTLHTYIRTYVRTYIHPSIHPYIHTYIHVHTCIHRHLTTSAQPRAPIRRTCLSTPRRSTRRRCPAVGERRRSAWRRRSKARKARRFRGPGGWVDLPRDLVCCWDVRFIQI